MGQGAHVRAPEISLGLSMSWGSIPRLINLVGPARTKQVLCLANDRITADDALAWGLVQTVVPDGEAGAHARTLADRAAAMPPVPLRMTKATVNAVAAASSAAVVHMDTEEVSPSCDGRSVASLCETGGAAASAARLPLTRPPVSSPRFSSPPSARRTVIASRSCSDGGSGKCSRSAMGRASRLNDTGRSVRASSTSTSTGEVSTSASRSARARRSSRWARASAVDLAPVGNSDHEHGQPFVLDPADGAVVPDPVAPWSTPGVAQLRPKRRGSSSVRIRSEK